MSENLSDFIAHERTWLEELEARDDKDDKYIVRVRLKINERISYAEAHLGEFERLHEHLDRLEKKIDGEPEGEGLKCPRCKTFHLFSDYTVNIGDGACEFFCNCGKLLVHNGEVV